MATVQLFLIAALLLYLLHRFTVYLFAQYKLYKQLAPLPGPPIVSPLTGHLSILWDTLKTKNPRFIMKEFQAMGVELCEKYGKEYGFFRLWFGPYIPVIVITDAMLAKKILTSPNHTNKSTHYNLFEHVFIGTSVITASGAEARHRRKAMQPFYSLKYLNWYVTKTKRNLVNLAAKIDGCIEKEGGRYRNADLLVSTFVYDSVTDNIFGCRFESIKEGKKPPYQSSLHQLLVQMGPFVLLQPWRHFLSNRLIVYPLNVLNHFFFSITIPAALVITRFQRIVGKLISRRHHQLLKAPLGDDDKPTQLDALFAEEYFNAKSPIAKYFGWVNVLRFALLFIIAGHDTTTSSLCWTLYLLAHHPDAQSKAREEVDQFLEQLAANNEEPNALNLKQLRYVECCIKEALRLYPVAPLLGRSGSEPFSVDDQFTIPPNVDIFVFNGYTHRQEKYFPQVDTYRPERFMPSEPGATIANQAAFPFSLGERNCIGQQYSMMQMKLFFMTILSRYEVSPMDTLGSIEDEYHFVRLPSKFDVHFAKRKMTSCQVEKS